MLNYLAHKLVSIPVLHALTYTSTRAIFGFLTAFILSLVLGRPIIKYLFQKGFRDYPRNFENFSSGSKQGTPTMGGVLIALTAFISILLWADLTEVRIWIVILSMIIFGVLGFLDDYAKAKNKDADQGASRIFKMIPQILFGLFLGLLAWKNYGNIFFSTTIDNFGDAIYIPFLKEPLFHASFLMLILGVMWSGGISNAVNYTDGLDGLLSIPAFFCFLVLGVFAFVMGHAGISNYLLYPFLSGAEELTVICSIFMGCCLGFLWFNSFPAEVFMGDCGSLMLGGALMTISFLLHQEAVFLIVGGIFIFQFFSSIIQEIFLTYKGKRLFRSAPFHEGLTKSYKMAEAKVVVRFWIVSSMLAAFALLTLKLR